MAPENKSFCFAAYRDYLKSSCLFRGIPEEKYVNVLSCLQARVGEYEAGASLVNVGDQDFRAGILLWRGFWLSSF